MSLALVSSVLRLPSAIWCSRMVVVTKGISRSDVLRCVYV